jgi:hypothetical protein
MGMKYLVLLPSSPLYMGWMKVFNVPLFWPLTKAEEEFQ